MKQISLGSIIFTREEYLVSNKGKEADHIERSKKKNTYSDDFKRKCISELMKGKEFSRVCIDNNIPPSTLSDWKKAILDSIGMKEKEERKLAETEKELQKTQKILEEGVREI